MLNTIIFIHRTPDMQLNSTLETIVLSLNQVSGIVNTLNNYTTPVYSSSIANFTQLTPTISTDYLIGEIKADATTNQLQVSYSCEAELQFTTAGVSYPSMTLKLVRKLQSEPTYNIATNTVHSLTYRSNVGYSSPSSFYSTFVFSNVYDRVAPNFYDYGIFIQYNNTGGTITATSMNVSNNNGSITILK